MVAFSKKSFQRKEGRVAKPFLWLIVGLGNPQVKHFNNRHNVGFLFIDSLVASPLQWQYKMGGYYIEQDGFIFLKPQKFMNTSGTVVKNFMDFFNIEPQRVCIVYDDVYLPFGSWRFRHKGSAGGHNGIADVIQKLGTEDIKRLRIGIGPKPTHLPLQQYVISDFSQKEMEVLNRIFPSLPFHFFSFLKEAERE